MRINPHRSQHRWTITNKGYRLKTPDFRQLATHRKPSVMRSQPFSSAAVGKDRRRWARRGPVGWREGLTAARHRCGGATLRAWPRYCWRCAQGRESGVLLGARASRPRPVSRGITAGMLQDGWRSAHRGQWAGAAAVSRRYTVRRGASRQQGRLIVRRRRLHSSQRRAGVVPASTTLRPLGGEPTSQANRFTLLTLAVECGFTGRDAGQHGSW